MKKKTTSKKEVWEDMGGNFLLRRKNYSISYNPHPMIGYEGKETALIKDSNYFILIGDFRKQYQKLKTYTECKKFFVKNKKFKGSWSN
jgi:hypothetical protein